ncbi:hypothetical protein [Chitinolyticbacter albus]|uniref:hypothetical protein n=1 Tax=Chitinolyticbacter albus TaxID=2961951 RepID=UPI0021089175|nr:hypothetical protein [Chitinolyticbacter albus]
MQIPIQTVAPGVARQGRSRRHPWRARAVADPTDDAAMDGFPCGVYCALSQRLFDIAQLSGSVTAIFCASHA